MGNNRIYRLVVRAAAVALVCAFTASVHGALVTYATTDAEHGGDNHSGGSFISGVFSDGGPFEVRAKAGGGYVYGYAFVAVGTDYATPASATSFGYTKFMVTISKMAGYEFLPDETVITTRVKMLANADQVIGTLETGTFGGFDVDSATIFNGGMEMLTTTMSVPVLSQMQVQIFGTLWVVRPGDASGVGSALDFGGYQLRLRNLAFDLPEGYVVNSEDGQVVDNYFVGRVPEPGTVGMVVVGVLAMVGRRRVM